MWALIASLFVGNVMLLALNLPLIRMWVKVLQIPRPLLYSGILVFATLGVYAVSGNIVDVLHRVRDRRGGDVHAALRLPDRAGDPRRSSSGR